MADRHHGRGASDSLDIRNLPFATEDEYMNGESEVAECACPDCDCYVLTVPGEICPACVVGMHPGGDE